MNSDKATWILNADILTQNEKREAIHGHILIRNGRIEAITSKTPTPDQLKKAQKLDATGLTLLPGFVQAHVHLCQTLFRNLADDLELLDWLSKRIWIMEAAHTPDTLYASAIQGIYELLSSGTTCLLDMATVRYTDAVCEAARDTGIRANIGKCLMDHPRHTPPSLRETSHSAIQEAEVLFKNWHGSQGDRLRISYAPRFVISCTEDLLKITAKLAQERNAIIHTHASENLKEIQVVKKMVNCENVEYLHQLGLTNPRLVLAHCIWLKPQEMAILQNTGTNVVHCPSSNLKLASGIARIPEMRARGINVALGADGAPCNNNLNMFQEMRLAALIHKPGGGPRVMRAQEVLDMATLGGAKALNWADEIGSIEVGKKADLFAIHLNAPENWINPVSPKNKKLNADRIASSVVYSAQAHHVKWTMVDGQIVYANGRLKKINTQTILNKVAQAQNQILKKVKLS